MAGGRRRGGHPPNDVVADDHIRGYNASVSNLDSLCKYFHCTVGDIAEYVPDADLDAPVQKSFRGPKPAAGRPQETQSKRPRTAKKPKTE